VGKASMLNDVITPDQTFVACPNQADEAILDGTLVPPQVEKVA